MASKKDQANLAAQKARKQKIIAIVGGILLLGIVAIQGPKLWKQLNPPQAASEAAAPVATDGAPAQTTTPAATPVASPAGANVVLAGVSISNGTARPVTQDGKLLSFTLFETKDPFVQQDAAGASATTTTASSASGEPGSPAATPQQTTADSGTPSAPAPPAKPTDATIEVNGKAAPVALKGKFPEPSATFVLIALTRTSAKIGVAGGSFESGKPLTLRMGKQVTLVDSATGVRYALKLVYSGSAPEKTQTFTSEAAQAATTKP